MAVVYTHRRLDTNKIFYVGIGRSSRRAYSTMNRNTYWKRIVAKVGYVVSVEFTEISWEEAQRIEQQLIAFYGRRDLGTGSLVNMTDGGEGSLGCIFSLERRNKISAAKKGIKQTEAHKAKISAGTKGRKRPPRTDEHTAKIVAALTGKKHTKEHTDKITAANKGQKRKPFTEEHKAKLSASHKSKREVGIKG